MGLIKIIGVLMIFVTYGFYGIIQADEKETDCLVRDEPSSDEVVTIAEIKQHILEKTEYFNQRQKCLEEFEKTLRETELKLAEREKLLRKSKLETDKLLEQYEKNKLLEQHKLLEEYQQDKLLERYRQNFSKKPF